MNVFYTCCVGINCKRCDASLFFKNKYNITHSEITIQNKSNFVPWEHDPEEQYM